VPGDAPDRSTVKTLELEIKVDDLPKRWRMSDSGPVFQAGNAITSDVADQQLPLGQLGQSIDRPRGIHFV